MTSTPNEPTQQIKVHGTKDAQKFAERLVSKSIAFTYSHQGGAMPHRFEFTASIDFVRDEKLFRNLSWSIPTWLNP